MATATVLVSGVRCERCIGRLAVALRAHEGIEYANANLMGEVSLAWDEDRTTRTAIGPSASYYAWEAAGRPVHGVKR